MRQYMKKKLFLLAGTALILLIIFHPDLQGRPSYSYIKQEDILSNLHAEVAANFTSRLLHNCDYQEILNEETVLSPSLVDADLIEAFNIREGGEYAPYDCKTKFSTAVIVPYRERAEQLRGFLVYMHIFLRHQRIHYRIYVVEQVDNLPFNRAKLLNIGARAAMKDGFPCLILHDVDLLPLQAANLYVCTKLPRHMSSSINKFRFVLPYTNLFGGAVAMRTSQYKLVNGMSNKYFGWGGEDDDLYSRLEVNKLEICRFPPETSRYHMATHSTEEKGEKTKKLLEQAKERMLTDGLNSLHYSEAATVLHPLFTHIMVDL